MRYTPQTRRDDYAPRRRDERGKLADLVPKPAEDRTALLAAIEALDAALVASANGSVRHIPTEAWNAYIDAAPRCECGRILSPERARRSQAAYCSERCYALHHKRRIEHKRRLIRHDAEMIAKAYMWEEVYAG